MPSLSPSSRIITAKTSKHLFKQRSNASPEADDAHLQRPHPPDPHLELALDALDALQLDALPPAATGRLAPKQKQLLGHTHGVATHLVAPDVTTQTGQCQAADHGLVRLASAVAPVVVVVEAATAC